MLPEATVPGYVLGSRPVEPEQLARAFDDLRAIAIRYAAVVVYGTAKIDGARTLNAAVCIGPDGRELGYAAKQFLWHFDRRWFAGGDTLHPIDTPLGRLGLLVCADGRIPTIASTLVDRGAQLLVMPTAWVTSGRDPNVLENLQADLMANVRARENDVPFVIANKSGVECESVAYCGKSAIIDASGTFVARGSERGEEIVYGDVQPALARTRTPPPAVRLDATGGGTTAARARIAFTAASEPDALPRLARAARDADCDLLIACVPPAVAVDDAEGTVARVSASDAGSVRAHAGMRFAVVTDETMLDPAGLVDARMNGIELFVWTTAGDGTWPTRFARTRAAELRAYVVTFDAGAERAFAVDPDGVVVAGTFDAFRMAAFAFDRSRAQATTVAPTTDVIQGLRVAESIRSRGAR